MDTQKKITLCNQIVLMEFGDLVVINDEGKSFPVPIIWGTDERAVSVALPETGVIKLPLLALHNTDITDVTATGFHLHYNLRAFTLYEEDANQIVEQILLKLSPSCLTSKIGYRLPLRLYAAANNLDKKEDGALRVIKWNFDLTLFVDWDKLKPQEA